MERGGTFPNVAATAGLDAHRSILHFNSSHPPAPPLPPRCLNPSREETPSGNGAHQFSWNADAKRTFHGVFGRDSDLLAIEGGILEAQKKLVRGKGTCRSERGSRKGSCARVVVETSRRCSLAGGCCLCMGHVVLDRATCQASVGTSRRMATHRGIRQNIRPRRSQAGKSTGMADAEGSLERHLAGARLCSGPGGVPVHGR